MTDIIPTQVFQNVMQPSNYMTLDNNSLNPYNYRSFGERENVYQQYQNMYYYSKQICPISMVNNNQYTRDPTNIPCDTAFRGIYAMGDANNNDPLNIQRSIANNPNLWMDKQPAKPYYRTWEQQIAPRQLSNMNLGHSTSEIYSHGFLIN